MNVTPPASASRRAATVISVRWFSCAACSSQSQTLTWTIDRSGESPRKAFYGRYLTTAGIPDDWPERMLSALWRAAADRDA